MPQQPDYGIDAPGVVRNLLVIGVALIVSGIVFPAIHLGNITILWSRSAFWPGGSCLLGGILMVLYAKWGKFRHRDMMLDMLHWRGDERVLDVGTGRGLLLIGAARRLTTGTATGIDIWSTKDLSGNSLEHTQANVDIEGVKDRVDLKSDDARKLSFPDTSFDVDSLESLHPQHSGCAGPRPGVSRNCACAQAWRYRINFRLHQHRRISEDISFLRAQGESHGLESIYVSLAESGSG